MYVCVCAGAGTGKCVYMCAHELVEQNKSVVNKKLDRVNSASMEQKARSRKQTWSWMPQMDHMQPT